MAYDIPIGPRHRPGKAYVCDARTFAGDRRLCPMHMATEEVLRALQALLTRIEDQADAVATVMGTAGLGPWSIEYEKAQAAVQKAMPDR